MSRLTASSASSLSAETARMDRLAGERRDESSASAPGAGGFAGLLRAAGVQPAAQSGAGEGARSGQSRAPGLNAPPKTAAAASTAASTGAPPAAPMRSTDATAQAKSAEARAQAERPRTSSTGAKGTEGEAVSTEEAGSDQTEAAQPAASGSATLAHWMMQLAAQRHGGIGLPQAGRGAGDAAGAGASAAGDAAAAGGAAATPTTSLNLPGWARPDAGAAAGVGVWAGGGGGQAIAAQSAPRIDAGGAQVAHDAQAPGQAGAGVAADPLNGFAGQLAALVGGGAPPPEVTSTPPAEVFVQTPVGSPGFGDEVMVKVAAFSLDGVQEAQLHLNPAELGPIQVRIALDGTQARIDFGAATDSTRALLEQALPALAEALQADGLQLAASSVASEVSEADPQADSSGAGSGRGQAGDGQADAGGGRPGGWGQQSEASAARSARAPGEPMRPGQRADGVLGWAGERPSGSASGGRGLDLYA